jgi:hypothetical protein
MNLNGVQTTQKIRNFTARSSFPCISEWRWVANSILAYWVDRNVETLPYQSHSKAHQRFSVSSQSESIE